MLNSFFPIFLRFSSSSPVSPCFPPFSPISPCFSCFFPVFFSVFPHNFPFFLDFSHFPPIFPYLLGSQNKKIGRFRPVGNRIATRNFAILNKKFCCFEFVCQILWMEKNLKKILFKNPFLNTLKNDGTKSETIFSKDFAHRFYMSRWFSNWHLKSM